MSVFITPKGHICNIKDMNYIFNIGEMMLLSVGNISYPDTIDAILLNILQHVFSTLQHVFVNFFSLYQGVLKLSIWKHKGSFGSNSAVVNRI